MSLHPRGPDPGGSRGHLKVDADSRPVGAYARGARKRRPKLGDDADRFMVKILGIKVDATGQFVGRVLQTLISPASRLTNLVAEVRDEVRRQGLLGELFGLRGQMVLVIGSRHPDHTSSHPDNVAAARGVMRTFGKFRHRFWPAMLVQDKPFASRLVLGSPTSTEEVADAVGFVVDETPHPGALPILPPYLFGSRSDATAVRYVGGTLVDRPLTTLYDVRAGLPLPMNGGRTGTWLEDDYVVVTHLPLMTSPWTLHHRLTYTSIAGVTGVGTKACGQLLQDLSIQQAIRSATGNARYYQAVCQVKVDHRATDYGFESVPAEGSLTLVDAVELDIDDALIGLWLPDEDEPPRPS